MNRDPLSNPEGYETDEEIRERPATATADIAQEHGTSPLTGISGPQDFHGGRLGQAPAETAASGVGWNVTGPVDEVGHVNVDQSQGASDDAGDEESPSPQER